jgi:hypothetical protein
MKRFNDWLARFNELVAIKLSSWFASMACFWAINVLCILPLIWPRMTTAVQLISSSWFQAIALPLLAVSGVIIGKRAEIRAEQDHIALMLLVEELHKKHDEHHGPGRRK